jgi:hypothetical protein
MERRKRVRKLVRGTNAFPDGEGRIFEAASDEESKGIQRTNL